VKKSKTPKLIPNATRETALNFNIFFRNEDFVFCFLQVQTLLSKKLVMIDISIAIADEKR
jgi:hypothetical protein